MIYVGVLIRTKNLFSPILAFGDLSDAGRICDCYRPAGILVNQLQVEA
jgi:hypothetical protein